MKSETVLLITSAQNDLLAPGGKAWSLVQASVQENRVPEKLALLANAARQAAIPVLHSPVVLDHDALAGFDGLSAIQRLMLEQRLLGAGTRGSGWIEESRPRQGDIVLEPRRGFSSFWAGTIKDHLVALGAKTLYIAGMLAEGCVSSHARDAVENGYRPVVVSDAIGATSLEMLAAARLELALHTDALRPAAEVVAGWRRAVA